MDVVGSELNLQGFVPRILPLPGDDPGFARHTRNTPGARTAGAGTSLGTASATAMGKTKLWRPRRGVSVSTLLSDTGLGSQNLVSFAAELGSVVLDLAERLKPDSTGCEPWEDQLSSVSQGRLNSRHHCTSSSPLPRSLPPSLPRGWLKEQNSSVTHVAKCWLEMESQSTKVACTSACVCTTFE